MQEVEELRLGLVGVEVFVRLVEGAHLARREGRRERPVPGLLEEGGELLGELLQIARAHGAIKHGHQTAHGNIAGPGGDSCRPNGGRGELRLYTEGWHKSRAGKRGKDGQHGFGGSSIQQPQAPKHTRLSMLIMWA